MSEKIFGNLQKNLENTNNNKLNNNWKNDELKKKIDEM